MYSWRLVSSMPQLRQLSWKTGSWQMHERLADFSIVAILLTDWQHLFSLALSICSQFPHTPEKTKHSRINMVTCCIALSVTLSCPFALSCVLCLRNVLGQGICLRHAGMIQEKFYGIGNLTADYSSGQSWWQVTSNAVTEEASKHGWVDTSTVDEDSWSWVSKCQSFLDGNLVVRLRY